MVAPTRELAIQIYEEALLLGSQLDLPMHAVYGGVDYIKQLDKLAAGVDLLIGTPGRLIDYHKQRVFTLKDTEIFVADEADRMFDMGFIDDLRYLMRSMPKPAERISFLYSATLSQRVLELAYEHMGDVHRVAIDEEKITAEGIDQTVYHVNMEEKLPVLVGLLEREKPARALIFVNTRIGAARVAERLEQHGFKAGALIGLLDQRRRMKMLQGFKDNQIQFLVATDVASRGLHIDAVSHVFNYDLPQDPEDYVHRIGRTARAGATGKAISLACERYVYSLEAIEEFIGMRVPHSFPEEGLAAKLLPAPRRPRGDPDDRRQSRGGGRSSPGGGRGGQGGRAGAGRGGRGGEPRSQQAADAPQAATPAGAGDKDQPTDGPAKKKRRRRRSRPAGTDTAGK